jgi:glycosyltransferase involved in cell wall biosynthesis
MQRQQVGHRESGLHGQLVVDWLRSIKRAVARIGTWRYVRQLQAIERDLLCSYTRVVAVSRVEAAHLRRLAPDKSVDVLASGVDVDYFGAVATWPREHSVPRPKGDTLVFLGSLAYHPNIHALQFFMDEVWPLVKRRRPHVRFWIVGASPGPAVQAMAEQDGVEVFASVPDVRPYLAASTVAIVPLFLGSGTRLKILEALAAHLPVVSTTFGAEGLDLEPGRDVLLADTAGAFAEAVCSLLECPDRAQELAHHGWETVRRAYSWDGIRARFRVMIQEVGAAHACGSL